MKTITSRILNIVRSPIRLSVLLLFAIYHGEAADRDPNRVIQYRGRLPLLSREDWGKEVEIRFELYRSPEKGTPFWSEVRKVQIATNGWVNLELGEMEPLPNAAFTTAFRFLSVWKGETEFVPRKQIASLAYAASPYDAGVSSDEYLSRALANAKAAAGKAPNRQDRLDKLVSFGEFSLEKHPRVPATWLEAADTATRLGARLPTFEEWYQAFDSANSEMVAMDGHYEWVVPWVYDPAIHGRMNELYKGKPVACYYDELNPLNSYPFRLTQSKAQAEHQNNQPEQTIPQKRQSAGK